jgi:hypothetical protein
MYTLNKVPMTEIFVDLYKPNTFLFWTQSPSEVRIRQVSLYKQNLKRD